ARVNSSTSPSQSLSIPSQTSGVGATAPWQTISLPPAPSETHAVVPVVQAPTFLPHTTGVMSSTTPLQLSSRPLHSSGLDEHAQERPSSMAPSQFSSAQSAAVGARHPASKPHCSATGDPAASGVLEQLAESEHTTPSPAGLQA